MQIEHRKMVARSNNETRLEKMKKRNECIEKLKILAINRLQNQFNRGTPQYQQTLKNLIIQVSQPELPGKAGALTHFFCCAGNDQALGR